MIENQLTPSDWKSINTKMIENQLSPMIENQISRKEKKMIMS